VLLCLLFLDACFAGLSLDSLFVFSLPHLLCVSSCCPCVQVHLSRKLHSEEHVPGWQKVQRLRDEARTYARREMTEDWGKDMTAESFLSASTASAQPAAGAVDGSVEYYTANPGALPKDSMLGERDIVDVLERDGLRDMRDRQRELRETTLPNLRLALEESERRPSPSKATRDAAAAARREGIRGWWWH
jgi:hypothetical protein